MLQLTETANGQLAGVFSNVALKPDGNIDSTRSRLTGAIDHDEITMSFDGLFGGTVAGTVSGGTIKLQRIETGGDLLSWTFSRQSASQFETYASDLRAKAQAITFAKQLSAATAVAAAMAPKAEAWISEAELHLGRLPRARDYYEKVEQRMRQLVAAEHATSNAVRRTQISVAVIQGNIVGNAADTQADQTWDPITSSGASLNQALSKYPAQCGSAHHLEAHGASPDQAADWESACKQLLNIRPRFYATFERVIDAKRALSDFQAAKRQSREALVSEASALN